MRFPSSIKEDSPITHQEQAPDRSTNGLVSCSCLLLLLLFFTAARSEDDTQMSS